MNEVQDKFYESFNLLKTAGNVFIKDAVVTKREIRLSC